MLLTVALITTLAQPLTPPPSPPPGSFFATGLPTARLVDDRDALLSRIMAIDHQLRQPAPTYVGPLVGGGLGLAGLTFGLTVLGISLKATGIVVALMVLGTMAGVVGLIGAVVAGIYGWGEAVRRAQMDERREKLLEQLDQSLSRASAATPRTP